MRKNPVLFMIDKNIKEIKKKNKVFKTNITIEDQNLWNWFKYESRRKGFNSVSNYLSFLIQVEKINEIFDIILLKEFEKYYEFITYSYKDISSNLNIDLQAVLDFIEKNELEIIKPETYFQNYRKNVDYIHKLMFEKDILPREFKVYNELSKLFNISKLITNKDLLNIIYKDSDFKRREILNFMLLIFDYANPDNFQEFKNPNSIKNYGEQDIISNFYENGIEIDEDDLEIDSSYQKLKDFNALDLYYYVFNLSIFYVIKKELSGILYLIENRILFKVAKEDFLANKIKEFIQENINNKINELKINLQMYNISIPDTIGNIA